MNKTTQIKVLESSNLVNCLFSLKFSNLAYKPLHDAASASLTTIILNKTPCSLYFLNLFFIVNSIIGIPHIPSSLPPLHSPLPPPQAFNHTAFFSSFSNTHLFFSPPGNRLTLSLQCSSCSLSTFLLFFPHTFPVLSFG